MYSNLSPVRQIISWSSICSVSIFLLPKCVCGVLHYLKPSAVFPQQFHREPADSVIALVITSKLRSLFAFSRTWFDIPLPVGECMQRSPFNKPIRVFLLHVQLPFAALLKWESDPTLPQLVKGDKIESVAVERLLE